MEHRDAATCEDSSDSPRDQRPDGGTDLYAGGPRSKIRLLVHNLEGRVSAEDLKILVNVGLNGSVEFIPGNAAWLITVQLRVETGPAEMRSFTNRRRHLWISGRAQVALTQRRLMSRRPTRRNPRRALLIEWIALPAKTPLRRQAADIERPVAPAIARMIETTSIYSYIKLIRVLRIYRQSADGAKLRQAASPVLPRASAVSRSEERIAVLS